MYYWVTEQAVLILDASLLIGQGRPAVDHVVVVTGLTVYPHVRLSFDLSP